MSVRQMWSVILCSAVVCTASVASADAGRIELIDGQVLVGDIQQVAANDYVLIRLPNGDLKAIAWSDIKWFAFDGAVVVAAPPPRPPVVVTHSYPPAPPPPPPRPPFEPRWFLGTRVGTMMVGGNVYGGDHDYYGHHHASGEAAHASSPRLRMRDVASAGWMFEGDVGYRFSPSWTVYGFWEHGELNHGDRNDGSWSYTNAAGVGVNVNTAPYDTFGFYFDMGASYRWMSFSDVSVDPAQPRQTRTTVEGFDFLRAAVGVAITMSRSFRLDPHVYVSSGYFTGIHGRSIESQGLDAGYHTFSGVAVGGRWEL